MHSTSLLGVLFTRALHAVDETAPALDGATSAAATHSGSTHKCGLDDLTRGAMNHPSNNGFIASAGPLYRRPIRRATLRPPRAHRNGMHEEGMRFTWSSSSVHS